MTGFGVYKIECNGKLYVGSTAVGFPRRWNRHLHDLKCGIHCNRHLQRAFNKHGEDALRFSIIEVVETPEEVISLEQHYIDTLKPEYNICPIAGSSRGIKCAEETKRKISETMKGRPSPRKGSVTSEETKQKLREAGLGNTNSLGYKHSEETRRKDSEASKGRVCSEETRQKLSIANKGHSHKGHPMTEQNKVALRKAHLGSKRSVETRKKISEARKLYLSKRKEAGALL